jgi:hypothetical protein
VSHPPPLHLRTAPIPSKPTPISAFVAFYQIANSVRKRKSGIRYPSRIGQKFGLSIRSRATSLSRLNIWLVISFRVDGFEEGHPCASHTRERGKPACGADSSKLSSGPVIPDQMHGDRLPDLGRVIVRRVAECGAPDGQNELCNRDARMSAAAASADGIPVHDMRGDSAESESKRAK